MRPCSSGEIPKGDERYAEVHIAVINDGFVGAFRGGGPMRHIIDRLGAATGWPVIDEREHKDEDNRYVRVADDGNDPTLPFYADENKATPAKEMREILADVSDQLHVTFKIEKRKYTRWVLTEK